MKTRIAAIAAAFALACTSLAQAANTWGRDFSDMWWNPAESGWGINVAHQNEVVFLTIYVYESGGTARWFVASNMQSRGGADPYVFDGALYQATGPFYDTEPFDPSGVALERVGTATISFTSIGQASITYTVGANSVAKTIFRQTFRQNDLTGSYRGMTSSTIAGCPAGNGIVEPFITLEIAHPPSNAFAMVLTKVGGVACNLDGTYQQRGKMGSASGFANCSDGSFGDFSISEVEANAIGFLGRFTIQNALGCQETGTLAAIRR